MTTLVTSSTVVRVARQSGARTAHRSFAAEARLFANVSSLVEQMTSFATAAIPNANTKVTAMR